MMSDGSSFRKNGNQPGGSSLRPVTGGGGGFSGDATSIQGKPVAPGGVEDDGLFLKAGTWTPGLVNAVELQGNTVDPSAFTVLGEVYAWDGAKLAPTVIAGAGDVVGPAGATDETLARFDGATGKLLQDSLIKVDDAGNMQWLADADILPFSHKGASIGADLQRFEFVYTGHVKTGHLEMEHETRRFAHFLFEEFHDRIKVTNPKTGREYLLGLTLHKDPTCSTFHPRRLLLLIRRFMQRLRSRAAWQSGPSRKLLARPDER
jgi:hypothetical protein